jgi:SAM-dependent methyltransferase
MTGGLADRARFRAEYAAQRAAEGRRASLEELLALPFLDRGPLARQWGVKASTFAAFQRRVVSPLAAGGRRLRVLDLGAGNGWLCYRLARGGHQALALDLREDSVDGLGAAARYLERWPGLFTRVAASFDALPLAGAGFDLVVFDASLHYATDLAGVLREAARVAVPGGRVVILDSPFYRREARGEEMVAEKRARAESEFGDRAAALMALPFIEFLTPGRLADASRGIGLRWRRHRVRYPLWYELRPWLARLRGGRPPSRFDLWEATVP